MPHAFDLFVSHHLDLSVVIDVLAVLLVLTRTLDWVNRWPPLSLPCVLRLVCSTAQETRRQVELPSVYSLIGLSRVLQANMSGE